jgi:hypothetical protein
VEEGEGGIVVTVVFEHAGDAGADLEQLKWIAEEVADDADTICRREVDQHDHVRALVDEGAVHRVPHALVPVDDPFGGYFFEAEVEPVAAVTDPIGTPLPTRTRRAPLDQETFVGKP